MEKLIEKLDQYEIFNNLIPGIMYLFLMKELYGRDTGSDEVIEYLGISYICGTVISRFGSVCLEPLLKDKLKILVFTTYDEFASAEEKDLEKKVSKLSMVNNMYRSLLSMAVIVGVTGIWIWAMTNVPIIKMHKNVIVVVALIIIFGLSYKKQTNYIRKRVELLNRKEEESKEGV